MKIIVFLMCSLFLSCHFVPKIDNLLAGKESEEALLDVLEEDEKVMSQSVEENRIKLSESIEQPKSDSLSAEQKKRLAKRAAIVYDSLKTVEDSLNQNVELKRTALFQDLDSLDTQHRPISEKDIKVIKWTTTQESEISNIKKAQEENTFENWKEKTWDKMMPEEKKALQKLKIEEER